MYITEYVWLWISRCIYDCIYHCVCIYHCIYHCIYLCISLYTYYCIYISEYIAVHISLYTSLCIYMTVHITISLYSSLYITVCIYETVCITVYHCICMTVNITVYITVYIYHCTSQVYTAGQKHASCACRIVFLVICSKGPCLHVSDSQRFALQVNSMDAFGYPSRDLRDMIIGKRSLAGRLGDLVSMLPCCRSGICYWGFLLGYSTRNLNLGIRNSGILSALWLKSIFLLCSVIQLNRRPHWQRLRHWGSVSPFETSCL